MIEYLIDITAVIIIYVCICRLSGSKWEIHDYKLWLYVALLSSMLNKIFLDSGYDDDYSFLLSNLAIILVFNKQILTVHKWKNRKRHSL